MPEEIYDWIIRTKDGDKVNAKATYHSIEDGFIRFKTARGATIYMIAVDQVLDIGRVDPNGVG